MSAANFLKTTAGVFIAIREVVQVRPRAPGGGEVVAVATLRDGRTFGLGRVEYDRFRSEYGGDVE